MNTMIKDGEELIRCSICSAYLAKGEGFVCPECKRGPLCKNHRLPGSTVCTSCVFEKKTEALSALKRQEDAITNLQRLIQFLFIVFAILFVAVKLDLTETIDFLREGFITEGLQYMGGVSVMAYIVTFFVLRGFREKVRNAEMELKKVEFLRRA